MTPAAYQFDLTCPHDGHPVEHVATGTSNGWETRAVGRCTHCSAQLLIAVTVQSPNAARRATPAKRTQLASARHDRAAVA